MTEELDNPQQVATEPAGAVDTQPTQGSEDSPTGTQEPTGEPTQPVQTQEPENFEKRYNDLRPEYTRATQRLGDIERQNATLMSLLEKAGAVQATAPQEEPEPDILSELGLSDDEPLTTSEMRKVLDVHSRRLTEKTEKRAQMQVQRQLAAAGLAQAWRTENPQLVKHEEMFRVLVNSDHPDLNGLPVQERVAKATSMLKGMFSSVAAQAQEEVKSVQRKSALAGGLGSNAGPTKPSVEKPETVADIVSERAKLQDARTWH
jgi:hypothetical protein